jgi:hypothetical protein
MSTSNGTWVLLILLTATLSGCIDGVYREETFEFLEDGQVQGVQEKPEMMSVDNQASQEEGSETKEDEKRG